MSTVEQIKAQYEAFMEEKRYQEEYACLSEQGSVYFSFFHTYLS